MLIALRVNGEKKAETDENYSIINYSFVVLVFRLRK